MYLIYHSLLYQYTITYINPIYMHIFAFYFLQFSSNQKTKKRPREIVIELK